MLVMRDRHVPENQTLYDVMPYTVIKVKGTMVTATRAEHTITRNVSHFKVLKKPPIINLDDQSDDDDDDVTGSHDSVTHQCMTMLIVLHPVIILTFCDA